MKLLLKRGARTEIPDSDGKTALEQTRMFNQVEVEKLSAEVEKERKEVATGAQRKKDEKRRGKLSSIWKKRK
jgi:hypothetical protein